MAKKGFPESLIIFIALFIVAVLMLNCINDYTAPIIEANNTSAQYQTLYAVMPEAKGFEEQALDNMPMTVTAVYKETSGLGYALKLSTNQGYTGEDITLTMAVDNHGKIIALNVNSYPETKEVGEEYLAEYLGQDSAMADVGLVAGVTFSSSAIKNAVNDGFNVLIDNGLISEGVKSDEQLIMELLPTVYPGIANNGIAQYEEMEEVSGSIVKAFKAANGSGFGFIMNDGQANYLGIWTVAGGARLLDTDGNEVDNSALLEEMKSYGEINAEDYSSKEIAKLQRLTGVADAESITPLKVELYSSVTGVYIIDNEESPLYGIVARSYGYSNLPMAVYYVLDADGAIVSMTADELIFYKDYFSAYTLDEPSYKEGFAGLTAESYTGENALIAGATMSTQGVDTATKDVFAAFAAIG